MPVQATAPSEAVNELSDALDTVDATEFVRVLRSVDAQVFSGWRHHPGLLDEGPLRAADRTACAGAKVLSLGGVIILTGCGTSGRIAHLLARQFNRLLPTSPPSFAYLHAGGDAALLLSDELPEDDAQTGATQLAQLAKGRSAVCVIGISCGLSAAYVAGQLDLALCSSPVGDVPAGMTGYCAAALGFNPSSLARDAPIGGLKSGKSFRDIIHALEGRDSPWFSVINPVVGAEAIAGSSRMKGGTASLILADAICNRAMQLFHNEKTRSIAEYLRHAQEAVFLTYSHAQHIGAVSELAAAAMRSEGRLFYVGEGTAGVVGCIDASEMPDTYGTPFDTVRAFVCGGWRDVANREGELGASNPLLRISLQDFEAHVLHTLSGDDTVIFLTSGAEAAERVPDSTTDFDGMPSDRLWSLVSKLREANVGNIGLLAVTDSTHEGSLREIASAHKFDAAAIITLDKLGLSPGHGMLAALSLKLMANAVSTYAMTARGLVFRNRMIATSPTNDKIYHRCIHLIAELACVSDAEAKRALLRSIYRFDTLSTELLNAPSSAHIIASTPQGDAKLQQQLVLPLAILLAASPATSVAVAMEALRCEPRVSLLLRGKLSGGREEELLPASVPSSDARIPAQSRYAIGLDCGATSIKCAVISCCTGKLVGR